MGLKRIDLGGRWLNVEERGAGRPLLLVHGFPLDHTMWTEQFETLSSSFRVIAPDLPGFGHSDPVEGVLTMDRMADDLAGLLDALGVDEPLIYCGLSMGGYVGWRFVDRYGHRVWRLIQCDTKAAADSPDAAKSRRETADRVLREGSAVVAQSMRDRLFAAETAKQNPEIVAAMESVMLATPRETIAAALRGMAERPDSTKLLPRLKIPTLLLCGEDDVITPPKEMRGMAEAIPHSRFVEIPAAGHMAPLESPAAVSSAILEFLTAN
jgi:pimeloyl-ACP methyl ester carboxylesterase